MPMNRIMITLLMAGLVLTSCSVTRSTYTEVKTGASVQQMPVVADIETGPKVEKTISWANHPFNSSYSKENQTENAIFDILKEYGADVLIEPHTVYVKTIGHRKLTVTGYPARFVNIRKATEEDLMELRKDDSAHRKSVYPLNFDNDSKTVASQEIDRRFHKSEKGE